jgi:hypothetical protein
MWSEHVSGWHGMSLMTVAILNRNGGNSSIGGNNKNKTLLTDWQ